jgi:hypothetical protein
LISSAAMPAASSAADAATTSRTRVAFDSQTCLTTPRIFLVSASTMPAMSAVATSSGMVR